MTLIDPAMKGYSRMEIAPVRPKLRIVADTFNNVNRLCTIASTAAPRRMFSRGRIWQVKVPMQNVGEGFWRWYVCENIHTGERVIVPVDRMSNLY